jgi:mRNA interferase RelE/StbE
MNWIVEFTKDSSKQIQSLDKQIQTRIRDAIVKKLIVNPTIYLEQLTGDKKGFYKFRVGEYRLICSKEEKKLLIMVMKVKHRRESYR